MRLFRRPTPGGNNYEIPLGCLAVLAVVFVIEAAVILYRILTYPERHP